MSEPLSAVNLGAGPSTPDQPLSVVIGLESMALGGCPINALDLGRSLRERGHTVNVFAIDEPGPVSIASYAERSGFPLTRIDARAGALARTRQIRRFADAHSADVIHVFAPWLGSAAVASIGGRSRRIAVVTNWTMENVRYTPRQTPMIVGTRAMQVEAQGFHGAAVHLMEPPVDIEAELAGARGAAEFRLAAGLADDDIVVTIVSRIASIMKAESIGYAIAALGRLDHPRLRLVIVGDGDAFDEIAGRAEAMNSRLRRPAVVLTGALDDPRSAYAAADVVMGMGGSALRAMAHSKPVIVLGERGFAKALEPRTIPYFLESGFYGTEPAADPIAVLSEQLESLIDPQRGVELGRIGHELVISKFGLGAATDSLVSMYRAEIRRGAGTAARTVFGLETLVRAMAHQGRAATKRRLDSMRGRVGTPVDASRTEG
ncbi:glycosyltransferase family 4 protein [Nakamurella lactea]|uniref:glycosyltransferase family 4 protein n=1 Tax=Nakamurella lactea TaxID=459515 RepID=UPI0003FED74E|nr:glycosyltransferase family 4 protein [Nakamurella lactea]